jgi:cation diffusion facilitator family transporter
MKSCCEAKADDLKILRGKQAKVLKAVLAINLLMFFVEFAGGWMSQSTALMADSLDMLGDATVYGFSLYVLHKSDRWRAGAALLKGVIISLFGLGVLGQAIYRALSDTLPAFEGMGLIGALALAANAFCLYLLTRHKDDDLNMRSTYICSRNDIISNTGVLLAAALVWLTGSKWPDIAIGLVIAFVFLRSALPILLESWAALRRQPAAH